MDSLNHLTQARIEKLPSLPSQTSSITAGNYVIKCLDEEIVYAWDSQIQTKIWFKSPPLTQDMIRLISGIKLFAESHDQGECGDEEQGNWTWFQIAIMENEHSTSPKRIGNKELVKTSHVNSFCTNDYTWLGGQLSEWMRISWAPWRREMSLPYSSVPSTWPGESMREMGTSSLTWGAARVLDQSDSKLPDDLAGNIVFKGYKDVK